MIARCSSGRTVPEQERGPAKELGHLPADLTALGKKAPHTPL